MEINGILFYRSRLSPGWEAELPDGRRISVMDNITSHRAFVLGIQDGPYCTAATAELAACGLLAMLRHLERLQ